jgi:hypothetical protein
MREAPFSDECSPQSAVRLGQGETTHWQGREGGQELADYGLFLTQFSLVVLSAEIARRSLGTAPSLPDY